MQVEIHESTGRDLLVPLMVSHDFRLPGSSHGQHPRRTPYPYLLREGPGRRQEPRKAGRLSKQRVDGIVALGGS
jgi:hypothetical protein